jgi:hypothetical protein
MPRSDLIVVTITTLSSLEPAVNNPKQKNVFSFFSGENYNLRPGIEFSCAAGVYLDHCPEMIKKGPGGSSTKRGLL